MKKLQLLIVFTLFSVAAVQAQEIRTKVNESTFNLKPDAVKEEQLDEATTFVFAGAGYGRRTGKITTGITFTNPMDGKSYVATNEPESFQNGVSVDLGFRHFFTGNIGIGVRTGMFISNSSFIAEFHSDKNAKHASYIYQGAFEVLYRHYLSSEKTTFIYGSAGLGWSYLNQTQTYRFTKTEYEAGFFNIRPAVGINAPVWDVVHLYAEAAYSLAQGKVTDGNLSLSQFQLSAGVHIRLNSF